MLRSIVSAVVILAWAGLAVAADDAKVTKGAQIYADQKCAICHSVGDKGNKKGPLDTVGSKYSADDLKAWVVDAKGMTAKTKAPRVPAMKNYTLAKDDLDALVAYMASLKK
jgi:mono/diheme cytochrome c family protein